MKSSFFSEGTGGPVLMICGISAAQALYLQLKKLYPGLGYGILGYEVEDWNRELSPWAAPPAFGKEAFAGEAGKTLEELTEQLLPEALPEDFKAGPLLLAGYSLAGLFSLWALYETDLFQGAASCSGSLWYPGWQEFAASHTFRENSRVYLSLGTKEEKTRNPVMSCIGDRTREQYERLQQDPAVGECCLKWHPGGHFNDPEGRLQEGALWLMTGFLNK